MLFDKTIYNHLETKQIILSDFIALYPLQHLEYEKRKPNVWSPRSNIFSIKRNLSWHATIMNNTQRRKKSRKSFKKNPPRITHDPKDLSSYFILYRKPLQITRGPKTLRLSYNVQGF